MAEDKSSAKAALGISTVAIIAAAIAASRKPVAGAPPGGQITLPPEFVQLVAAILASSDSIDSDLLKAIDAIGKLSINVQGFPPNARGIRSFAKVCAIVGQAYEGDDMTIPEGMDLIIKSYPLNPAASIVQVASSPSDATNPNSSWPLMPNEAVAFQVQNANQIYVSATIANCIVIFSAERVG